MGMFQNSKITLLILNVYALTSLLKKDKRMGNTIFVVVILYPMFYIPWYLCIYMYCFVDLPYSFVGTIKSQMAHCCTVCYMYFPRKANMYPTKLCILIRLTLNWGLSSMYKLYSQPLHNTMYSPSKHFQRKNILHTPLSALYSWSNIEYFFHFDINFWHFWSSWSISNLYWLQWSEDDKFFLTKSWLWINKFFYEDGKVISWFLSIFSHQNFILFCMYLRKEKNVEIARELIQILHISFFFHVKISFTSFYAQ